MKNYTLLLLVIIVCVCAVIPVSARQEVLVSDRGWIKRFDATNGAYIDKLSGAGLLAAGSDGIVYIGCDRDIWRIRIATGERLSSFSGMQSGLSGSKGLTMAPDGKLYVSDTYNNRILRFDTTTGVSQVVQLSQTIRDPRGIALGSDGDLYVCGYVNWPQYCVARFNATNGQLVETYPANSGITTPTSLAAAPNGDMYVVGQCGGTVYRLNRDTKQLEAFLPWVDTSGVCTGVTFTSDGRMLVGVAVSVLGNGTNLMVYNPSSGACDPFTSGNLIRSPSSLIVVDVVPEPSSLLALLAGLGTVTGILRRKR